MTLTADPEHIAISRSRGIRIDWKDGHQSNYDIDYLRAECPCATCAGTHGTPAFRDKQAAEAANPLQMFKPKLKMEHIEEVGNYALRINWSDGHNTGIYSYDHLRAICPCPECRGPAPGSVQ